MKRLIDEERELEMTENIPTTPPTTLLMPKSETSKVFKITRLVYSATNMVKRVRTYNISVFLAIRFVFSCWVVIVYLLPVSRFQKEVLCFSP